MTCCTNIFIEIDRFQNCNDTSAEHFYRMNKRCIDTFDSAVTLAEEMVCVCVCFYVIGFSFAVVEYITDGALII